MRGTQVPTVLHLIDTGGPGGAETVFSQLVRHLGDGDTRSVAVIPREGWLSGQLRTLGVEPVIIDARGSLNIAYLRELVRLARQNDVQLIHTHLLGSAVYGALLGLLTRRPVIAVMHGPHDFRTAGRFPGLKRWLLGHACRKVVAVSASTREAMIDFGIQPGHITLVPNGVDTRVFSVAGPAGEGRALRDELKLGANDVLIGAVGNIRAPKAYDVLLNAAALLLKRVPNACFAVVGEGNEKAFEPLLALRKSLGLESRFHFLGFRKTTPELLRNFDVFVSSSRSEGLPLSFLEAMATGRTMVATRSGGAEEVIEPDRSGWLVPIENPQALADALERAAREPELRARLGKAARERVEKDFSLQATVQRYASLYAELLPK